MIGENGGAVQLNAKPEPAVLEMVEVGIAMWGWRSETDSWDQSGHGEPE